jgi:hypothetical protein
VLKLSTALGIAMVAVVKAESVYSELSVVKRVGTCTITVQTCPERPGIAAIKVATLVPE